MNAIAVAKLTFGHLINLDRRIADNVIALRVHLGEEFREADGLFGKTLAFGQNIAERSSARHLLRPGVVASSRPPRPRAGVEHGRPSTPRARLEASTSP